MTDGTAGRGDVGEDAIIAFQHGRLAGRLLPAPHDDIGIGGVDLQQDGAPPG